MSDSSSPAASAPRPQSRKKSPSRWPIVLGAFVVVLLAAYFFLTSAFFVTSVVVPKVSTAMGSDVKIESASLSPFSSVRLTNLRVTPKDGEQLVAVKEVVLRYSLTAIMGGTIQVSEITLNEPQITLVVGADGTSNLDKFLEGLPPSTEPDSEDPSVPNLAISNIRIVNGNLKSTRPNPAGGVEVAEVSGLELTIDRVANGEAGKMDIRAGLRLADGKGSGVVGTLGGQLDFGVEQDLAPGKLGGSVQLKVDSATGDMDFMQGFAVQFQADAVPGEIRQLEFAVSQNGERLGAAMVKGTYDVSEPEARLEYSVSGIDRRVLGLLGKAVGVDLGNTSVAAAGRLDLLEKGKMLFTVGQLNLAELSADLGEGATPAMDVQMDFRVTVNQDAGTALFERLDVQAEQGGNTILKGALDRPMHLAWRGAAPGFRESTYSMTWSDIKLQDWRMLLGQESPSGIFGGNLQLTAEQDGRLLRYSLATDLDQLSAPAAGAGLSNGQLKLAAKGSVTGFEVLVIDEFTAVLAEGGTKLLDASGRADWHTVRESGGVQFALEATVPALLTLVPVAGVSSTAGDIRISLQANHRPAESTLSATASLGQFDGRAFDTDFKDYRVNMTASGSSNGDVIDLSRLSLAMQTGYANGGSIDVTGRYRQNEKRGTLEIRSSGLNQSALAPFADAFIAPNKLKTVQAEFTAKATVDLRAESAITADLAVSNLQAQGPDGLVPEEPLAVNVVANVSQNADVVNIGGVEFSIAGTSRAANVVTIAGRLDMRDVQDAASQLTVQSEGLDLTPLMDLMGAGADTGDKETAETRTTVPPVGDPDGETEPAAMELPIQPLTIGVDIARLYLREVDIKALKANIVVRDNKITVDPFEMALNEAPVSARLLADVGVPGYRYEVKFSADKVPMPPLVNSFAPEQKGRLGGVAAAQVDIRGAGVTGASLQKNLAGQMDFNIADMNLMAADVKSTILTTIISIVIDIPELIRNPAAAVGGLLNRVTGRTEAAPGWVDEISRAPLQTLKVRTTAGNGQIKLEEAQVQSAAFQVDASGVVTLASILTNSTVDIPIQVALKDSLGAKIGLTTPQGQTYAPMPQFLTVKNTVGAPDYSINRGVIAGLAGRAALGIAGNTGEALRDTVGNVLGGVTGALGGGGSTNAPSGQNPIGGLLRGLGGQGRTNAPSGSQPATTNETRNPLNLLRGLRQNP